MARKSSFNELGHLQPLSRLLFGALRPMSGAHDIGRSVDGGDRRERNGTLKLRSTNAGLWYELTPNADSPLGREAIAMVGSDTVNDVSVSFAPEIEEWNDERDLPRRLITQARLYEVSLVLWGAYGKATSASLRSDNAAAAARRRCEAAQRKRGIR